MPAAESRENQRLAIAVAFLLLAVAGMSKCIPALAAILLPSLQSQLGDHLGAGVAPLWTHEIVVLSMTLGAFFIWRHDTGLAALFSLVGALYGTEPLLAVGIETPPVELLLVPLFVVIAGIEPEPVTSKIARTLLSMLFMLSLTVACSSVLGWFDFDFFAPWGDAAFDEGSVWLGAVALIAVAVIVARCRPVPSLKSASLWVGFGVPTGFLVATLLEPLNWLTKEPEAVILVVLCLPLAPIGVCLAHWASASYRIRA